MEESIYDKLIKNEPGMLLHYSYYYMSLVDNVDVFVFYIITDTYLWRYLTFEYELDVAENEERFFFSNNRIDDYPQYQIYSAVLVFK